MKQSTELRKWIARNEESLRLEYRAYGIQHDYDLDGVMSFDAWAEREYRFHLDHLAWERSRQEGLIA